MNPGWNQPNQGQTPPQGWGNQIPPTGWGGQQAWGNPQQPNQIYNNANNQWSQWGQQNNQVYGGNPGFVMQTEQQGNSKSWNQHSGWGIQLEKSEPINVPFFQMPQQAPQQAYQQSYSLPFSPVITNQGTTAENQSATKNSLKLDLSKQYIICSALDTTMVADVNKDEKNKNQLMLWKKHGESNQRYKLVPVNNRFMIVNMASNLALEIEKSSPTRGALIMANTQIGSPNQLWQLSESKQTDGGYFIRTFCGKCWDLCEWKTSAGTPIIQYDFNGGRNQVWHLKPF